MSRYLHPQASRQMLTFHHVVNLRRYGAEMKMFLLCLCFACIWGGYASEKEAEFKKLKKEIQELESFCSPKPGITRAAVEKIFGKGKAAPPVDSKMPYKGKIPEDSPRRGYRVCENGYLVVHYDKNWIVKRTYYPDPYASKGLMAGTVLPIDQRLREARQRLAQMRRVKKEYKKKIEKP